MLRRITLPLVVDLLIVDSPKMMTEIDAYPSVTRDFSSSSAWPVRLLGRRFRRIASLGGSLLPALLPREDATREARSALLRQRLRDDGSGVVLLPAEVAWLAAYVRGGHDDEKMAQHLQGLVGRQFLPNYSADATSLRDARLIDRALRSGPLRSLWWRLIGTVTRARRRIGRACDGDIYAAHGTVIAVHNLIDSMRNMRRLYTDASTHVLPLSEIVDRTLVPPRTVLRTVSAQINAPFLPRSLTRNSLIVFKTKPGAGADAALAQGRWSACPAHGLVRRLLSEVWVQAIVTS